MNWSDSAPESQTRSALLLVDLGDEGGRGEPGSRMLRPSGRERMAGWVS